eukprot:1158921-Pelagomonas_calceolata.AAC.11
MVCPLASGAGAVGVPCFGMEISAPGVWGASAGVTVLCPEEGVGESSVDFEVCGFSARQVGAVTMLTHLSAWSRLQKHVRKSVQL